MNDERPSKQARWPVLRISPGHDVVVCLLSGSWIRLATHFSSRTFLCTDTAECPACEILPARCFWYLPALVEPTGRPCLLELSNTASSDLEQVAKFEFGSIGPGFRCKLTRKSAKAPVRAEAQVSRPSGKCSDVSEWGSCLMAVYGLPALRPGESITDYGDRVRSQVFTRAAVVAARVKAGPERGVRSR